MSNWALGGGIFISGDLETSPTKPAAVWSAQGTGNGGLRMLIPNTTGDVTIIGGTLDGVGSDRIIRIQSTVGLNLTLDSVAFKTSGTPTQILRQESIASGNITIIDCTSDGDLTHSSTGFAFEGAGNITIQDTVLTEDTATKFIDVSRTAKAGNVLISGSTITHKAYANATPKIYLKGIIGSITIMDSIQSEISANASTQDTAGIFITASTVTDCDISGNTLSSNSTSTWRSIVIDADVTTDTLLVDNNECYYKSEGASSGGLLFTSNPDMSTTVPVISNNRLYGQAWYDPSKTSGNHGLGEIFTPSIIKNNLVYGAGFGVVCKNEDSSGIVDWSVGGVFNNMFYGCSNNYVIVSKGADNLTIANNTVAWPSTITPVICVLLGMDNVAGAPWTSANNILINNILKGSSGVVIAAEIAPGLTSSNNVIYSNEVSLFEIAGVAKTRAEWQAEGWDTDDSLYADPQLIERTSGSLLPDYNSPAIGAGIVGGSTTLLHPFTDFPNDSISTMTWSWSKNIGAFATFNTLN
jgi:hypothetical protein